MAEQYETEIEQILKDTADKVNFFKSQMDAARDEARLQEIAKVPCTRSCALWPCIWGFAVLLRGGAL